MTLSRRRFIRNAAIGAAVIFGLPSALAAQAPTPQELMHNTDSGSYLAARHASVERDASSAAAFYRSALRTDPKNNELLDRAFIAPASCSHSFLPRPPALSAGGYPRVISATTMLT